jgi:hypothetical protein
MRFYYRIYQKTKVLTRKRKKKRTRATSGPHQPAAKKLRTLDLTALAWNGGSETTTTASPAIGNRSSGGAAEAVTRMETDTTALPPTAAAATAVGGSAALPAGSAAVSKSPEKGGSRPAEKAGASVDKRQPPGTAADKTAAISDVRKPVKSGGVGPSAPAGGNKVEGAKPPVAAGPAVKGGKPEASTSVSVAPTAAAKSVTATAAMGNKVPAPQVSGAAGGTKQGPAQVGSEEATKAPTTSAKPVPPAAVAYKPVASVVKKPIVAADKGRESAGKVNKSGSSEAVLGDGDGVRKGDKPVVQANGGHTTTAAETAASKKADQDNTVSKVTGQSQQQVNNNSSSSSSSNRGGDKTPSKLAVAEKKKSVAASPRPRDGKEVVEISVEVSASDVKKVLEKKRAEKDAAARLLLPAAGEERLYSNYSIVDQIKKAGTAASLARQQTERASMMDFARTSEALASAPRVPPILQGLQPRLPPPATAAPTEPPATTVLSAIVQNLAQKQQQKAVSDAASARASPLSVSALVKDTTAAAETSATAAGGKPLLSSEYAAAAAAAAAAKRTSPKPGAAADAATAKTLGAIVAPALSTGKGPLATTTAAAATPTSAAAAASSVAALAPKLPGSTSIQAVSRDGKASPTAVETSGPAGQQMLSFYKSSFAKAAASSGGGLSEAVKSAESLTKNIPAGTTVTVKTIENKSGSGGKISPPSLSATPPTVPSPAPPPPSSPKNSAFRMNLSGSTTFHTGGGSSKTIANPYASMAAVSQASLINPFVHSTLRDSMTMALAAQQAQFLNFSNHQPFVGAAAALAAQMEAANFANNAVNYVRAAQQAAAAQRSSQSSSPMTTLEFTKAAASLSGHLADDRYGVLKIPQPGRNNPSSGGSLSSFGTNRLQVKVNPDGPAAHEGSRKAGSPPSAPYQVPATTSASDSSSSPSQLMANGKHVGTHSMPAILPFHGVKKVQALPKTASHSSPRPVAGISSVMGGGGGGKSPLQQQQSSPPASPLAFPKASPAVSNAPGSPLLNTLQSLTDANPFASSAGPTTTTAAANSNNKNGGHPVFSSVQSFKAPPSSVGSVVSTAHSNLFNKSTNVNSGGQQQQPPPAANNSLKKLAADLNTAQQKTLKGDNVILNALKKSGGNIGGKLSAGSDFGGKGFGGKGGGGGEVKKVGETGGGGRKEVTTSS